MNVFLNSSDQTLPKPSVLHQRLLRILLKNSAPERMEISLTGELSSQKTAE
jgi:hypothetical protein